VDCRRDATIVVPSVFVVSASMLMTESPFGLSSSAEFQREIDAAKAVTPIPSGSSWPAALQARPGTYYSHGGAYQSVESTAICLWFSECSPRTPLLTEHVRRRPT
jgi:hypothetical protein